MVAVGSSAQESGWTVRQGRVCQAGTALGSGWCSTPNFLAEEVRAGECLAWGTGQGGGQLGGYPVQVALPYPALLLKSQGGWG